MKSHSKLKRGGNFLYVPFGQPDADPIPTASGFCSPPKEGEEEEACSLKSPNKKNERKYVKVKDEKMGKLKKIPVQRIGDARKTKKRRDSLVAPLSKDAKQLTINQNSLFSNENNFQSKRLKIDHQASMPISIEGNKQQILEDLKQLDVPPSHAEMLASYMSTLHIPTDLIKINISFMMQLAMQPETLIEQINTMLSVPVSPLDAIKTINNIMESQLQHVACQEIQQIALERSSGLQANESVPDTFGSLTDKDLEQYFKPGYLVSRY